MSDQIHVELWASYQESNSMVFDVGWQSLAQIDIVFIDLPCAQNAPFNIQKTSAKHFPTH